MESLWNSVCSDLGIDQEISQEWLSNIKSQYSGTERFYHNEDFMLNKKLQFLMNSNNKPIFLATIFQHYHYDTKKSCATENCDTFNLFVEQGKIKDVSILSMVSGSPFLSKF